MKPRSLNLFFAIFSIAVLFATDATAQKQSDLSWLTEQERQWLLEHPIIRVAPTPDYPPFEFWSEKGEFQGIVKSYLSYFAETLDVKFDVRQTLHWSDNIQQLKDRDIDAVSLLVRWDEREFVTVSDPYIVYPAVIIVRSDNKKDLTMKDLAGKEVAVPNDYTGEYHLRNVHPDIIVREADGPADGIRMVSNGDVDAFFGGASVVAYMAEKEGMTNLRVAGVSNFKYSNGFGVRSDWAIFAKIISKTLDRMPQSLHRDFHSEWVTSDFFRRQWLDSEGMWIASGIAGLLLLGTGLVLVWNRKQAKLIGALEREKKKTDLVNMQLDKSRLEAETANLTKSSFVANISHEIRTPMNGILGMCELLRTSELDSQQRNHLKLATQSAKNLLSLIDDILDFSKIEAGKLELEVRPFSLTRLLNEVHGLMSVQAQEKGLQLIDQREPEVTDVYLGDALRVRQILLNLTSNAIKFTKQGTVNLRVFRGDLDLETDSLASSNDEEPQELNPAHLICFEVKDTGTGIAADNIDKLFEPFEQEDASTTRKHGGTGLGLAICKNLAKLMGGSVYATSTLGKGSTFSLTAQLKPDYESLVESIENEYTTSNHSKRILLAEDGVVNQKVAIGLLEKRGHVVDLAENGRQALEALEHNHYDVVLMDIQMPEMDGLTAVREIRKNEAGTQRHQRVIALTAHAMVGDQERFIEAGMDDYLPKPFNPEELYGAVERPDALTENTSFEMEKQDQVPVLDRDIALATTGGDQDLAQILLDTCIEETPKMLSAARTAVENSDWAAVRRSGHSMKSSFAAVGAMDASAKSKVLEFVEADDAAQFNSALDTIEHAFTALQGEAKQVSF